MHQNTLICHLSKAFHKKKEIDCKGCLCVELWYGASEGDMRQSLVLYLQRTESELSVFSWTGQHPKLRYVLQK